MLLKGSHVFFQSYLRHRIAPAEGIVQSQEDANPARNAADVIIEEMDDADARVSTQIWQTEM